MKYRLSRENTCLCCESGIVTESVQVEMLDSDRVPDQANCDYSNYSDYRKAGGEVLRYSPLTDSGKSTVIPVVCSECLGDPRIHNLTTFHFMSQVK